MIVTVTANPAVDQTVRVHHLDIAAVNRFFAPQLDASGKGVNVSRMAHRLGWSTIALGFLAGEIGMLVEQSLDREGVPHHFVCVPGQTRLNMTVVDETTGSATHFLGPGPTIGREHFAQLDALLLSQLPAARILVLAGNLPPGAPDDIYATYVRLARARGVQTIVDADGEALRLAVAAKPSLIKPNLAEAERLLGRKLPDLTAVAAGARELVVQGVATVVISLGARGAIGVQGARVWLAVPPELEQESTVGAGDSFVAGLAVALASGKDFVEGLRQGTAAGAATAITPGTAQGTVETIRAILPQVRIEALS